MRPFSNLLIALVFIFALSPILQAETYKIDPEHSSVSFKIRHLLTKVQGNFKTFEGTIDYSPNKIKNSGVNAVIDVSSIDTNSEKRDEHLKSKEFFDAQKFPKMTFKSLKVTKVNGNKGELAGKLTMRGVTKPVVLDVEIAGTAKDPWGNEKAGFTATTKINRKDFGVDWNTTDKSGNLLLGDEVEITLEIEAIKKS